MKISKKLRFLFSLTSLIVCLCMTSVAVMADDSAEVIPYAVEETTMSAEDAKTYADGKITLGEAKSMVEQMVSAVAQFATCSPEELDYVADVMSYQTDIYTNFAKTVGENSCGAYISYDNVRVEETEEKDSIDVIADVHFENLDLKMILHVTCFDTIGSQVTSTEFSLADEGNESFGEKMVAAGSNTLVGMAVVFCVLIFISLIISCFGFIPKIMEKIQNSKNKKEEVQVSTAGNTPVEVVEAEDNSELIAVIAAAIAASEQTSTDSFVVRSIRRR